MRATFGETASLFASTAARSWSIAYPLRCSLSDENHGWALRTPRQPVVELMQSAARALGQQARVGEGRPAGAPPAGARRGRGRPVADSRMRAAVVFTRVGGVGALGLILASTVRSARGRRSRRVFSLASARRGGAGACACGGPRGDVGVGVREWRFASYRAALESFHYFLILSGKDVLRAPNSTRIRKTCGGGFGPGVDVAARPVTAGLARCSRASRTGPPASRPNTMTFVLGRHRMNLPLGICALASRDEAVDLQATMPVDRSATHVQKIPAALPIRNFITSTNWSISETPYCPDYGTMYAKTLFPATRAEAVASRRQTCGTSHLVTNNLGIREWSTEEVRPLNQKMMSVRNKFWSNSYESDRKYESVIWVFEDDLKPITVVRSCSVSEKMDASFVSNTGHVSALYRIQKYRTADRYTMAHVWSAEFADALASGAVATAAGGRSLAAHRSKDWQTFGNV
ncbi:hypothetical protein EVAR_44476_1 [Eumeta japonica]|uniref:Uncharacterized protein n=1 Tax=Eumeta variegata TaxID=151549 RepID=A0A4C1WJS1_EUMVA|nr:hypothetical protein EVAR_44476_1 [Eumeta japonica]